MNDFLSEVKTQKVTKENRSKLQRLVKQVLAFDDGGKVKTDREKGGIACSQSVKNRDYSKSKLFKDLVSYLGDTPSLKLLFDVMTYYLNKRKKITSELLPAIMQDLGVMSCDFEDGHSVSIETDQQIAVIDQTDFFLWLEKNGYDDHIKMNLAIKGSEYSEAIDNYLCYHGISYEKKYDIHWQTRNKIIRDRIEAGEPLPDERVLSVTPIEKAEVK